MEARLLVRVISNSSCEEVLSFKCCNLHGMNLEIRMINAGKVKVAVKSEVELFGERGRERIDYLYPHGLHVLGPKESLSFYCSFDEERMKSFSHLEIRDGEDKKYRARITGREEEAERIFQDL